MYNFNFHSPSTIDEAVNIYNGSEEPKFLAGGMTLLASMKQRLIAPSDLIDLRNIKDLSEVNSKENHITIGSLCTHSEISNNDIIKNKQKLIKFTFRLRSPVYVGGTISAQAIDTNNGLDLWIKDQNGYQSLTAVAEIVD